MALNSIHNVDLSHQTRINYYFLANSNLSRFHISNQACLKSTLLCHFAISIVQYQQRMSSFNRNHIYFSFSPFLSFMKFLNWSWENKKRQVIRATIHEPAPLSTMMHTTLALTYQDTNRTFPKLQHVALFCSHPLTLSVEQLLFYIHCRKVIAFTCTS